MDISDFLPLSPIVWLYPLFSALRFENQRWIRAIAGGKVGASPFGPIFANVSGLVGLVLMLVVLVELIVFAGWQVALGTIALSFFVGLVISGLVAFVFRGDSPVLWILATIAMWPVGYLLQLSVSQQYF